MNRMAWVLVGSVVVVGALLFMMNDTASDKSVLDKQGNKTEPLMLFCAASNRGVMELIRLEYESEFHRSIQIQYGASQTLLSAIEVSETGDLYLPADDSFIELGRQKNLLSEVLPLATMRVVAAVRRGNPKGIREFAD
ncbi:MAG: substrate-binding domain-containing protein, partial [Pirellula staleyi]